MGSKPKKKKKFLVSSIIIFIIGFALIFSGIKILSMPKMIFKDSFSYFVKPVKKFSKNNNILKDIAKNDKIMYSTDINLNLGKDLNLGINNVNLEIDLLENKNDKVSNYYINSKLDNKQLLEVKSYLKNSKLYFTISDIFDNYYYTDMEYVSLFDTTNTENIEILVKNIKNAISDVITDKTFNKESLNAEINGKYENLTRLSLNVTDKLLSDVLTKTINNIKNDEESLNALVSILEKEKNEVITMLDDTLTDINDVTGEVLFTYNIYYNGINNIRKLELISDDEIITYTGNEDIYKLTYSERVNNIFTILLTGEKNNNYRLDVTSEELNIKGNITKNKNIYHMSLSLKDRENNNLGDLTINFVDETKYKNEINVSYKHENIDVFTISMASEYSFGNNIEVPNLSTSKDINLITEDETMNIMNNLSNHSILGPIIQMFSGSMM